MVKRGQEPVLRQRLRHRRVVTVAQRTQQAQLAQQPQQALSPSRHHLVDVHLCRRPCIAAIASSSTGTLSRISELAVARRLRQCHSKFKIEGLIKYAFVGGYSAPTLTVVNIWFEVKGLIKYGPSSAATAHRPSQ